MYHRIKNTKLQFKHALLYTVQTSSGWDNTD